MKLTRNDSRLITVSDHIASDSGSNTSVLSEEEVADSSYDNVENQQVMFLYLNQEVFKRNAEELTVMLK